MVWHQKHIYIVQKTELFKIKNAAKKLSEIQETGTW